MSRNLFEDNEPVPVGDEESACEVVVDSEEVPDEVLERLRSESGFTTTAQALMALHEKRLIEGR